MSSLPNPDPLDYAIIDPNLEQCEVKNVEDDLDHSKQQPSAVRPHEGATSIIKEPFDYDGLYLEG